MATLSAKPDQEGEAAGGPCEYWAFISYSSKDRDTASWLIKRIESYRIPSNLAGMHTSIGKIPKRLYPLFRDRDELRAAPDLKEELDEALRASRYLIVLCSPNSAKTTSWVNKEVTYFQQLGRNKQIIPIIVSGEPNASLRGKPELECFPPALRYTGAESNDRSSALSEPLAADLNREDSNPRESKRKALLKVIAAMIDVDFDDLEQRDRKRRRQRLLKSATLGLVLFAMIGFVLFRWYGQSVENSARSMAREAKQLVDEDPEIAALLSLRSHALNPDVAAYDGLIAVATSNPYFQSVVFRGQGVTTASIDRNDAYIAVAACASIDCTEHALWLIDLDTNLPIGSIAKVDADRVVEIIFHPQRDQLYVTTHHEKKRMLLRFNLTEKGLHARPEEILESRHTEGWITINPVNGYFAHVFGKWNKEKFDFAKVNVRDENFRSICTQEFYAPIERVAISPDGKQLAVISDFHVSLVDIEPCKVRRPASFTKHGSGDVQFSTASNELYSVGYDGILYRLDPAREISILIGAPLRFSATDYHHVLSPGATHLASREGSVLYLMNLVRYLDLNRKVRESRESLYRYIAEREKQAYRAATLKLDDNKLVDYGFSISGALLYTVNEAGSVAVWRTSPFMIRETIDPPDASWQCPYDDCEVSSGRNLTAETEDSRRALVARLRTSLTECGGDKKHDCLLISNVSLDDLKSGLTVRTFEFQERTGPLWQRLTRVEFNKDGKLLVANGNTVSLFHLDLESLAERVCVMAGDLARIKETDRYLNTPLRTLFPKIGRELPLCASGSKQSRNR